MSDDSVEEFGIVDLEALGISHDSILRLQFICDVASFLEGTYDERGIRNWFYRSQEKLGNKSPVQLLGRHWTIHSDDAKKVYELAHSVCEVKGE